MLTVGILSVSLFTSYFIIATGYFSSSSTNAIKEDIINRRDGITIADIDNVRSDFYECVDNTAMFWQIQSINCFQSSVSTSIMQFTMHSELQGMLRQDLTLMYTDFARF